MLVRKLLQKAADVPVFQSDNGNPKGLLSKSRDREKRHQKCNCEPHTSSWFLRLWGRLTGPAHPNAVLLFQVDPLRLRTEIAAPVEDIHQRRRLRDIEIHLAKVRYPQIPRIFKLDI